MKKVIDLVKYKHNELLCAYMKLHMYGDGCATQFRSYFVFALMKYFDKSFQRTWYYNERHHWKSAMYGVGGTVKEQSF